MVNKSSLERDETLVNFYGQMGYSEKELYKYDEPDEDLMDYDGKSELSASFNLKKSDILAIIKVITESAAYQRSSQKSMMATRSNTMIPPDNNEDMKRVFQDSEALIQTRQTHMREVAEISKMISNGLGLNGDFAYLIGLLHDVGHTWNGHSGERMLSAIARLENCGYIVHNAMGAYIIERENIIDTAIEEVKQFNSKAKEEDIREFMRYVIDGVVSHNGEGTIGKIIPDNKTAQDMVNEIRKCFTEKGYDKKIMPATLEGAIIRYADIIAYTRSDLLDGFRLKDSNGNKIITEFDDEYLSIIGTVIARENNYSKMLTLENKFLVELYGLSRRIQDLELEIKREPYNKAELNLELKRSEKEREMIQAKYDEFCEYKIQYAKEYISRITPKSEVKTKVTQMMQNIFIKDLVETSKGKRWITMSPLMRRTFFALRDLNARRIVPYTRRRFEAEQLPIAAKNLVDIFSDVLIKTGIAYNAIPDDDKEKNGLRKVDEQEQESEIYRVNSDPRLTYERKLVHYYSRLNSKKIEEIYLNCVEAVKDIANHDISIALGREEYDGELKELYEMHKIMPIKMQIGMKGKTSETMTNEDEKKLLDELVQERLKNIEKVVANKMAIEYIGGMTDNTIISVLLDKNIVSRKQIIEGYARPAPGIQKEDMGVVKLQKAFSDFGKMILPDDIDEREIML